MKTPFSTEPGRVLQSFQEDAGTLGTSSWSDHCLCHFSSTVGSKSKKKLEPFPHLASGPPINVFADLSSGLITHSKKRRCRQNYFNSFMGPGFSFFSLTKHVTERTFRCPHTPPKIYNFFFCKKMGKIIIILHFKLLAMGNSLNLW